MRIVAPTNEPEVTLEQLRELLVQVRESHSRVLLIEQAFLQEQVDTEPGSVQSPELRAQLLAQLDIVREQIVREQAKLVIIEPPRVIERSLAERLRGPSTIGPAVTRPPPS